ncbi:hypothetical protein H5J25_04150 [Sphingomonas aliaeris]|uniref:Uncharacterized protein n=1 Tax=Sphingomonas aliaeris TaxID=2759526 RepID=A0A974NW73_9SPHN|nr:hypothetical protein H5J25_04150 [Sphingomonas aliaeris]
MLVAILGLEAHHQTGRPNTAAIFALVPALVFRTAITCCANHLGIAHPVHLVVVGEEDAGVLADDFSLAPSEQMLGAWVPAGDIAVQIDRDDGKVGRTVENQARDSVAMRPGMRRSRFGIIHMDMPTGNAEIW